MTMTVRYAGSATPEAIRTHLFITSNKFGHIAPNSLRNDALERKLKR